MGKTISTPEKIRRIVEDIDRSGNARLTRLTVLKKWLDTPGRLSAMGIWIASRAAFESAGKEPGEEALIAKARSLLRDASPESLPNPKAAEALHGQVSQYKREFRRHQWGLLRIVHSWPLLLIEGGLALALGLQRHPADGYKLASDWAQNFDTRYGNGFNGPSRDKLAALADWMEEYEK